MTEEQVRTIIREELASLIKSDRYTFEKLLQILDGRNIQTGKTTGTKFPSSSDQKWGAFGATPVAQQSALTTADNTTIDATYNAVEQAVLNNVRTRVNEIQTILSNLGLTT